MRTLGHLAAPGPAVFTDHELITTGPFRLVRHPGYAAVQVLGLGIALGTLNWLILALWPALLAVTYFNARAEEKLLSEKFGSAYQEYAQQKNRFIPRNPVTTTANPGRGFATNEWLSRSLKTRHMRGDAP